MHSCTNVSAIARHYTALEPHNMAAHGSTVQHNTRTAPWLQEEVGRGRSCWCCELAEVRCHTHEYPQVQASWRWLRTIRHTSGQSPQNGPAASSQAIVPASVQPPHPHHTTQYYTVLRQYHTAHTRSFAPCGDGTTAVMTPGNHFPWKSWASTRSRGAKRQNSAPVLT